MQNTEVNTSLPNVEWQQRKPAKYPETFGDIRAERGPMIGMEMVKNGDPDQPDPDMIRALAKQSLQDGLVVLSCGVRSNVVRFLPALTISDELINEGLDSVEGCFKALL